MLAEVEFGPLDRLCLALLYRAPQVATTTIPGDGDGGAYVRVRCREAGPMLVEWTGTAYRWRSPGGRWETLSADPESTADAVAVGLGVRAWGPGGGG